jgi:hypothetical protein
MGDISVGSVKKFVLRVTGDVTEFSVDARKSACYGICLSIPDSGELEHGAKFFFPGLRASSASLRSSMSM